MRRVQAGGANAVVGALAVLAAGCASGGASEVPAEEPATTGPVAEAPVSGTATDVGPPAHEAADTPAPATPTPALFTDGQADRGRTAFDEACAECHTTSEFRGRTFQSDWGHRTVYSFFRTVRSTMPDDNPGGLAEETYLDVVSYILRMNGHGSGASEMTMDSPMREVSMEPPAPGPAAPARGKERT